MSRIQWLVGSLLLALGLATGCPKPMGVAFTPLEPGAEAQLYRVEGDGRVRLRDGVNWRVVDKPEWGGCLTLELSAPERDQMAFLSCRCPEGAYGECSLAPIDPRDPFLTCTGLDSSSPCSYGEGSGGVSCGYHALTFEPIDPRTVYAPRRPAGAKNQPGQHLGLQLIEQR